MQIFTNQWKDHNKYANSYIMANKYFDAWPPVREIIWRDATSEMGTYMYRPA